MKISKIVFKNINSLKGENVISFESEPLNSAGIFAITGPTGSGKSTILDVITLALFNRIPRFKKAMSKSEIEGMGSVITHHADDAAASITYEIHGKQYTSAWSVSKTRTGNLKDYEMFLYDADGTPMDLKRSEVPGKNEELIGLKYEQFIKSIILSQGQFAKFLKADKHERAHLLENLTGSYIYRQIGVAAFDKMRQIKSEVTIELDRLQNIVCLSKEERAEINTNMKESIDQQQQVDQQLKGLAAAELVKKDIIKFQNELKQLSLEGTKITQSIHEYKSSQAKLDTYDKLSPVRGELIRYQDAQKVISKLSQDIDTNEKSLLQSRSGLERSIKDMSELTGHSVDENSFMNVMSAFEKKVTQLDDNLKHVQGKGSDSRKRINAKITQYGVALDPKIGPSDAMLQLKNLSELHQRTISEYGISKTTDPKQLRAEIEKLQLQSQVEKEVCHLMEHANELSQKQSEASKLKEKLNSDLERIQPIIEAGTVMTKTVEENIALLQKQKQDAMLIASLSEHRHNLVDGAPCPLCGSDQHPYADLLPQKNDELDQRIAKAQEELQAARTQLQANLADQTSTNTALKLNVEQSDSFAEQLKKVLTELEHQKSKSISQLPNTVNALKDSIEVTQSKISQGKLTADALVELRIIEELEKDYQEFSDVLTEYKQIASERKTIYAGENVTTECNQLQDRFVKSRSTIETLETLLVKAKETLAESKLILNQSFEKLSPVLTSLGFEDVAQASLALMPEEEVSRLKGLKEQLVQKQTANSTKVKSAEVNLKEAKDADTMSDQQLDAITHSIETLSVQRDGLIRIASENKAKLASDDDAQARMKSKADEINQLKKKQEKWELLSKMIGDAKGNNFANFAQGLTLQNLLGYANRRLANLSDRYLLDRPFKDGELTVVDQYQGNTHRSVATLSGGESFLISLALALSLSDMASRNVRLESLFIDEGFGTLDQETLDIAMRTLEKLQTESQKTVGVISHVDTLKERINVQIQLEKNAQGYSSISIVA